MPVLDEILALELVEQGAPLAPLDRAVLLTVALAGVAPAEAPELPLDRRDRLLIDARMAAFGSPLGFFARCPHCGEGSEGVFDLAVLPPATGQDEIFADVGGEPMHLRAPTSADVAKTVIAGDPALLLDRCRSGPKVARKRPSISELEEALGRAFPLLDIRFDLTCSACEKAFDTRFDIVAWLWREIEGLARCAIDAVDRLARAYGWSEAEILALSPRRRALYLAKTGG